MVKKKILAISGSTRKDSVNQQLITAIAEIAGEKLELEQFEAIAGLPHFNADDIDQEADAVLQFRQKIRLADAVLICTPEYAHGVPGSLKNAIDWTVASADFSGKPTILITASTDGKNGHAALLETLRVIEAANLEELQLLISYARTKIDRQARITDEETRTALERMLEKLGRILEQRETLAKWQKMESDKN